MVVSSCSDAAAHICRIVHASRTDVHREWMRFVVSVADQVSLGERGKPRHEDGKAHPSRRQLDHFSEVRSFVVCVGWFLKLGMSRRDFTCVVRRSCRERPTDECCSDVDAKQTWRIRAIPDSPHLTYFGRECTENILHAYNRACFQVWTWSRSCTVSHCD
jgi:hypothetical protein